MTDTAVQEAPSEAPPKKRYRVMAGIHWERNPNFSGHRLDPKNHILCKVNDAIESDRPLDRIFPNKFEEISDHDPIINASPERKRLVTGLIVSGHWKAEDRSFLETLSEDGFRRILGHSQARDMTSLGDKPATSPLGEDVTSRFQQAYDNQYKVWRNPAGKHQVTRGDNNKPLNPSPLVEDKVEKFVESHLRETAR